MRNPKGEKTVAEIIQLTPLTEEEAFLEFMRWLHEENEKALFVVDNARMAELQRALELLSGVVYEYDPDAHIEWGFNLLFKQHGYIEIEIENLCVNALNMEDFREALSLASDVDFFPIDRGRRLRISLGFHDVMIRKT